MTKMMAVKITEATYPIAVACLAGGFATYPIDDVLGKYLIINQLETHVCKYSGHQPLVVLGNTWVDVEMLTNDYEFVEYEQDDCFSEIKRKKTNRDNAVWPRRPYRPSLYHTNR